MGSQGRSSNCKIGEFEFKAPFAIADSDDVPPILGRSKGLDLFEAMFYKGKETRLKPSRKS